MSVSFSVNDHIGTVKIDRITKLNALDIPTFESIESIVDEIHLNTDVYGLIFLSAGTKAFSVGADISELSAYGPEHALERARYRQAVLSKLSSLTIPTVAGIQGYALGGGLELALSCTFRLANKQAQMGFPEINLGLLPGAGGTQRLPKLIGQNRAMDIMLTARMVKADEALSIGLINAIVDDIQADSLAFIKQITRFSAPAVKGIITCIQCSELPLDTGLRIENQQLSIINSSTDAKEGVTAFLEKRPPLFNCKS